jgi:pyruvate, orthophosphate dikinase
MTGDAASRMYVIGGSRQASDLAPDLVGGKAAHLVRLARLGLSVPPAIALTTALCQQYLRRGSLSDGFRARLRGALRQLEETTGATLGGRPPLLVSVRSSPPTSMPGMLETVLNVGLNEAGVRGLIRETGNPWLAWDAYRRLVRSFAGGRDGHLAPLDRIAAKHLLAAGVDILQDLDPIAMRDLARDSAAALAALNNRPVAQDALEQIASAVEAVFRSWTSPWARAYRRMNGLDEGTGTGVVIQAMVFGNSGSRSGSGVGFTRNPATGDRDLYVDFVFNAQGEDVVSGRLPVVDSGRLPTALPRVWEQLRSAQAALEREFRDMQDFEFTVDEGQLFFLQTRPGKRTPWAALRIAADLVREGLLDPDTALERLASHDLATIARVVVKPRAGDVPLARGTPASIGVACGPIVFDADDASQSADPAGILVRSDIATDDIAGLAAAVGVLTTFGGRTSHAAVVARQLGKVCLVGCAALRVNEAAKTCQIGDTSFRDGDVITLDGETGLIYAGEVPFVTERPDAEIALVDSWRIHRHAASSPDCRKAGDG